MKTFLLTLSGIAALTLSSCLDTQTTAGTTGQNRFGYNGTTSANTQPSSAVQQGVDNDPVATTEVFENTQTQPATTRQNSATETIAIDSIPTNNSTNNASTDTASNISDVAANDTTTSANADTTATEDKPKKPEYLYGIPVPGRDGMVYSPYNKDAGYIDVRHMKPGALAEDPYTPGKLFRVP